MMKGLRRFLHADLHAKAPVCSVGVTVYVRISTQLDEIAVESGLCLKISRQVLAWFVARKLHLSLSAPERT